MAAPASGRKPMEVVMAGQLIKRGEVRKNWKKRHVVLYRSGVMVYFKGTEPAMDKARGTINVPEQVDEILVSNAAFDDGVSWPKAATPATCFVMITATRRWYFLAPDATSCSRWSTLIRKARGVRRAQASSNSLIDIDASSPFKSNRASIASSPNSDPQQMKRRLSASGTIVSPADIGRRVSVEGYCDGVIRFVGLMRHSGVFKVGIELDQPIGINDGTIKGETYFTCAERHGVSVVASRLAFLSNMVMSPDSGDSGVNAVNAAAQHGASNPFAAAGQSAGASPAASNPFAAAPPPQGSNPFGATQPAQPAANNPFAAPQGAGPAANNPFAAAHAPAAAAAAANPFASADGGGGDDDGNDDAPWAGASLNRKGSSVSIHLSELDQDAAAAQLLQMVQLSQLSGDESSSDESDTEDPTALHRDPVAAAGPAAGTTNPMQRVQSGELPFQPLEGGLTVADVGKRVEVAGPEGMTISMFGYLRYVGPQVMVGLDGMEHVAANGTGLVCGVELFEPIGNGSGTFDSFQYFQCAPCFAMLFKYSDARLIPPEHRKKNVDDWTRLLQNTSGSSEVISELEQKAMYGDQYAALVLAKMQAKGLYVDVSPDGATLNFQKSCDRGNTMAMYELGLNFMRKKDEGFSSTFAIRYFEMAAEGGNAYARLALAMLKLEAKSTKEDNIGAITLLKAAAEQGMAEAQWELSECYRTELAMTPDPSHPEKAIFWLQAAAVQGYPKAVAAITARMALIQEQHLQHAHPGVATSGLEEVLDDPVLGPMTAADGVQ